MDHIFFIFPLPIRHNCWISCCSTSFLTVSWWSDCHLGWFIYCLPMKRVMLSHIFWFYKQVGQEPFTWCLQKRISPTLAIVYGSWNHVSPLGRWCCWKYIKDRQCNTIQLYGRCKASVGLPSYKHLQTNKYNRMSNTFWALPHCSLKVHMLWHPTVPCLRESNGNLEHRNMKLYYRGINQWTWYFSFPPISVPNHSGATLVQLETFRGSQLDFSQVLSQ